MHVLCSLVAQCSQALPAEPQQAKLAHWYNAVVAQEKLEQVQGHALTLSARLQQVSCAACCLCRLSLHWCNSQYAPRMKELHCRGMLSCSQSPQ